MLQFLQTGKVLYVLAAVCALGIISKLVTGNLYKRLIKETGNMALTKNKNLRALKQKTENMFLLSHGLRNPAAYIEKQIYGFRFMKVSLDDWDNFSVQTMILCFLIGGVAAFGAYWYRCDSYYIVLYGTMGILSGLFMVLVDNGVNVGVKRQQLMDCLVDYVENSPHFYKNVDKTAEGERADRKSRMLQAAAGPGFRDLGRKGLKAVEETAASGEAGQEAGKEEFRGRTRCLHTEKAAGTAGGKDGSAQRERAGARFSVLSRKREEERNEEAPRENGTKEERDKTQNGDELARSIEYLRESLDQIAAGREGGKREEPSSRPDEKDGLQRAKKELKPEDLKLLGDILQEYLT
ncbi:MAG: hypothetical protein ACOX8F_02455 [Sakamotonia sp.]|jgi:hypothetical protein